MREPTRFPNLRAATKFMNDTDMSNILAWKAEFQICADTTGNWWKVSALVMRPNNQDFWRVF